MTSRDLGVLLFGLAGLYSLFLALLGVVQLLMQWPASAAMVGGQLRIQATFLNGVVSVLLHLAFGAYLIVGRRGITLRLLGQEPPGAGGASPAADGFAVVGVCLLAVLLLARVVTALSYAASLLWLRGDTGDTRFWTAGGIVTDLLLAAVGAAMVARRHRVAARLLATPARPAGATAGDAAATGWQLPAARFLGLVVVAWYLPDLVSALSVFVKWWLRPVGFDLRSQALERLPPAATGLIAGLYLLLLFPAGLPGVWRRLRPVREPEAAGVE